MQKKNELGCSINVQIETLNFLQLLHETIFTIKKKIKTKCRFFLAINFRLLILFYSF